MAMKHPSAQHRNRANRNWALLVILGGLSVLFYVITIVRVGGQG